MNKAYTVVDRKIGTKKSTKTLRKYCKKTHAFLEYVRNYVLIWKVLFFVEFVLNNLMCSNEREKVFFLSFCFPICSIFADIFPSTRFDFFHKHLPRFPRSPFQQSLVNCSDENNGVWYCLTLQRNDWAHEKSCNALKDVENAKSFKTQSNSQINVYKKKSLMKQLKTLDQKTVGQRGSEMWSGSEWKEERAWKRIIVKRNAIFIIAKVKLRKYDVLMCFEVASQCLF